MGSRWDHLPAHAYPLSPGLGPWSNQGLRIGTRLEPPVIPDWPINPALESQLDQELNAKRAELRAESNLPTALENNEKDKELKGFTGTSACVSCYL